MREPALTDPDVVAALEADGLVERDGNGLCASRRFRAALARAAARLEREGAPWRGLRLPIAVALVELRAELPDLELARRVEVLLALEEAYLPSHVGEQLARGER